MMIKLLHADYDAEKLESVIEQMKITGSPTIRGIYDESENIWIAIEGCHRIRAAKILGLIPDMVDITASDAAIILSDETGDNITEDYIIDRICDYRATDKIVNF